MANGEKEYVTKLELIETQQKIERKVTNKIDEVDKKVDTLNDIVLPLVETSKQTASNTNRMATTLDEFTKEQRKTNGKVYDRLHDHDLSLNALGQETKAQTDIKKANATITVAVISGVTGLIIAIFNLAPLLFE